MKKIYGEFYLSFRYTNKNDEPFGMDFKMADKGDNIKETVEEMYKIIAMAKKSEVKK